MKKAKEKVKRDNKARSDHGRAATKVSSTKNKKDIAAARLLAQGPAGELERVTFDVAAMHEAGLPKTITEGWRDNHYAIWLSREASAWGEIVHLWIRRHVGEARRPSWHEAQRIKNHLVGFDRVAVEVFPRAVDVVDDANMYHLWCLPPGFYLPFGLGVPGAEARALPDPRPKVDAALAVAVVQALADEDKGLVVPEGKDRLAIDEWSDGWDAALQSAIGRLRATEGLTPDAVECTVEPYKRRDWSQVVKALPSLISELRAHVDDAVVFTALRMGAPELVPAPPEAPKEAPPPGTPMVLGRCVFPVVQDSGARSPQVPVGFVTADCGRGVYQEGLCLEHLLAKRKATADAFNRAGGDKAKAEELMDKRYEANPGARPHPHPGTAAPMIVSGNVAEAEGLVVDPSHGKVSVTAVRREPVAAVVEDDAFDAGTVAEG